MVIKECLPNSRRHLFLYMANCEFLGMVFSCFSDSQVISSSTDIRVYFPPSQTYAVNVDKSCVGHKCFEGTNFEAIVDSGTSFTALPLNVYKAVTVEVDTYPFTDLSLVDKFCY